MHIHFPIVFITGHGDIPMSVRAMKGGAIEFLVEALRRIGISSMRSNSASSATALQLEEDKLAAGLRTRFETLTRASAK